MLIRCEKCNTLYELDESLLPAHGAPVQCSKCQFVFKAFPGGAETVPTNAGAAAEGGGAESGSVGSAEVPSGVELDQRDDTSAAPRGATSEPAPESGGGRWQARKPGSAGDVGAAAPEEPQFTADGRPIRKVPFPTEEPTSAGARPVLGRAQGRSTVSPGPKRRWALVVLPIALALVLVAIVLWLLGRRSGRVTAPPRTEGHSMILPREQGSPACDPGRPSVTGSWAGRRASPT